jgi:hypothetical protein
VIGFQRPRVVRPHAAEALVDSVPVPPLAGVARVLRPPSASVASTTSSSPLSSSIEITRPRLFAGVFFAAA